ncbi:uncharacterized protein LOC131664289 isoform X2 [Phymastichus coffea]|uniref:uncharacterized protein LOC131664289 isoform X2 n=1 Tax=Phymastichus coffea TaxID=108790 RepID=UPI00273CA71A|nr:uncharacterized protein LOC131664289 isoform X2 [Phymastichus coffea]
MGRLWLATWAVLLYSSVAFAGYSTNKKDLERAAELAVERAAEKAAERAVEKALNSGNSSTITVTVKEAYENTKKTAEEAAAPGSESTRPHNPQMYDRQYAYTPPVDGDYKVSDSAEAEELGVSKESLNSSVEDLGSAEVTEGSADKEPEEEVDVDLPLELASFESVKENADETTDSSGKDFDVSLGIDFGLDFGSLDMSGDFGSKSSASSKTETYSTSVSKDNGSNPVDVSEDEDAEVFGMYASDFEGSGWSSKKQKGWVRHRPLWDDTKSRVSRGSLWDDIMKTDKADEKKRDKKSSDKPKPKLFKRNAGDFEAAESGTNQVAVPLASLSLDPKAPALLYQLLQKELKYSSSNYSIKSPIPMRLYVTVPVPYLRANNHDNDKEVTHITPRPYRTTIAPKEINDEIDDQGATETKKPAKRSNNFGSRNNLPLVNRNNNSQNNYQSRREQYNRSLVQITKHKVELKSSTTKPILETARIKQNS